MAPHSTAKIFGNCVELSLTQCEPEEVECSIDSGRESLRLKKTLMSEPHHMDHNHMDHSNMGNLKEIQETDHSSMDHSQHSMSDPHGSMSSAHGSSMSHAMMGMSMSFHFGCNETILFDFWRVSSMTGLLGSMVGIFFMAALYEGLKYYREYLFWKTYNSLQYRSVETPATKNAVPEDNNVVHVVGEVIHRQPPTMLSRSHGLQTMLHIVQIVFSYFLMLIFMTYNVWLCAAVALGAATGYFLFGWKKSVIIDVTEHCH